MRDAEGLLRDSHEETMVRTSPRLAKDVSMSEEMELQRLESGLPEFIASHREFILYDITRVIL